MGAKLGRRLGYKDIFDDKPLEFSQYFKGVNKNLLLAFVSTLIKAAHPNHRLNQPKELVKTWFSTPNYDLKKSILRKIATNDGIINIISSLNISEYILKNEFDQTKSIPNAVVEVNIFKAYLLLNEKQDALERVGLEKLSTKNNEEKMLAFMLSSSFHDSDLMNYKLIDVFISQLVKSIEFFNYLDRTPELNPHLNLFLKKFNCNTWKEWLNKYLSAVLPVIKSNNESYFDLIVEKNDDYNLNCRFLDNFSIQEDSSYQNKDFITIRSLPLIKIDEGKYRVISDLFLIEKIFKSIQFLFSLKINRELPKAQRLKDFRGIHCDKFSEQVMLYQLIIKSFPKSWIHISGEKFKKYGYKAEPDYYLRNNNIIFLFESKDVVLKGEEKQSRDYATLVKALKEKFYKAENRDKIEFKAVLQILRNVKRILSHYYEKCDIGYNPSDIKIYPILITHDRQFDSLGVNNLINNWFQTELQKLKEQYHISNVYPLTVININVFLSFQDHFYSRKKIRLEELIEEYHERTNFSLTNYEDLKQQKLNSYISFSNFIDTKINEFKLRKMPVFINEYIKKIFPG